METFIKKITENNYSKSPYENYENYISDLINSTDLKIKSCLDTESIPATLIQKIDFIINSKLQISEDTSYFPILRLKKIFSLTNFQLECILIGLTYQIKDNYSSVISKIYNNYTIPTVMVAVESTSEENLHFTKIKKYITEDFLKTFFVFKKYKVETLYDNTLTLQPLIASYLLSNEKNFEYVLPKTTIYKYLSASTLPVDILDSANHIKISETISNTDTPQLLNIYGDDNTGKLFLARNISKQLNKNILLVNIITLYSLQDSEFEEILYDILRISKISNSYIALIYKDNLYNVKDKEKNRIILVLNKLFNFINAKLKTAFILSDSLFNKTEFVPSELDFLHLDIKKYNPISTQKFIWEEFSKKYELENKIDFNNFSNKFNFNIGDINKILKKSSYIAECSKRKITEDDIYNSCYSLSNNELEKLGLTKINSSYTFDDLILPDEEKKELLHSCNYIKLKHIVLDKWNFKEKLPYGNNLSILFKGLPGTGKTMGAQVIANELNMSLYRLDISKTVSKYIGETEENLNKILNTAEKNNVILFIDEMDAIFGKRSEVKSSHDKYANMQTSFLLQKIESYKGILVLATNYLENIDDAFIRRIKFIIHFPLPNYEERFAIWKNIYPEKAPLDKNIDFEFLAKQFKLSGGVIKNIALKSAYMSANKKTKIKMEYILKAIIDELTKQEKIPDKSLFKEYSYIFDEI